MAQQTGQALARDEGPESRVVARWRLSPGTLALIGTALGVLAFLRTLGFDFVYDDVVVIENNPWIAAWRYVPRYFTERLWAFAGAQGNWRYYRPMFLLWARINDWLFGLRAIGWHAAAVALHGVVIWLMYAVGKKILRDDWGAAIGAVLFAVMPVHIETVAWVSGYSDTLLAVFLLASILCFAKALEGGTRRTWWMTAAVALGALTLLTKETGIVLPVLALGFAWAFSFSQDGGRLRRARAALESAAPLIGVTIAYVVVRAIVLHGSAAAAPLEPPHALRTALMTLPAAAWFYAWRSVWPFGMSAFYDANFVTSVSARNFLLPLLGTLAAVVVLCAICRRSRAMMYSVFWFVTPVAIAIAGLTVFTPWDVVHDRYLYVPSIGLAWILGAGLERLARRSPAISTFAIGLAVVALTISTVQQSACWNDEVALYTYASAHATGNPLAATYEGMVRHDHADSQGAIAAYGRALAIDPHFWLASLGVGGAYLETRQLAQAETALEAARQDEPPDPAVKARTLLLLANLHLALHRPRQAEDYARQALAILPDSALFHFVLGRTLAEEGRVPEAEAENAIVQKLQATK